MRRGKSLVSLETRLITAMLGGGRRGHHKYIGKCISRCIPHFGLEIVYEFLTSKPQSESGHDLTMRQELTEMTVIEPKARRNF